MRDRSSLPYLVTGSGRKVRNMLYRARTLESIPEHAGENAQHDISWPSASDTGKQEKYWKAGINLPKLVNETTTLRANTSSKLNHRGIRSPKSSSFFNIANMPLSAREQAAEKPKREGDIKSAKYLSYEPTVADHMTAEIDLSRYAFRATLDRIPQTEGERLLSAHGKRRSNSGDLKKRNAGSTENSLEREKTPNSLTTEKNSQEDIKTLTAVSQLISGNKKHVTSLRSLDLYAQQRNQFAQKGPPTRVAFSCKMIQGDPHSFVGQGNQGFHEPLANSQHLNAEDVVFPRIVLYQWEVHEQPKFIKAFRPRKPKKKVHRIPTGLAPQEHQSGAGDGEGKYENAIRPVSSVFKFPQAPPPTPKSESDKECYLIRFGSPEH